MKKTIFQLLILFWALSPSLSRAQSANVWDFLRCVDHAIKENITMQQARLSLEQNRNDLQTLRQSRIPAISGSANQNLNTGRVIDPFTNSYNEKTINSASFSLNAQVTLFNGFSLNNQIQQQYYSWLAGQYDLETTKNNLVLSLANFYLQILQGKELVEMSKAQVENTRTSVERNQKLLDAGALRPDVLSALKAQLATDELNLVNAENTLQTAKINLQLLLLLPIRDDFDVVKPQITLNNNAQSLASGIEELYKETLVTNPSLKAVETRSIIADYALKVAKAAHSPRLSLFGNVNTLWSDSRQSPIPGTLTLRSVPIGFVGGSLDTVFGVSGSYLYKTDSFGKQLEDNLGKTIGLSLSVPIYAQGQINNGVKRARINRQIALLNQQQQKNTLYQDVTRAYTDYKAAYQRLDANQKNLDAQKEAYNFAKIRFDQGLLNTFDFLITRNNAQRAELALIQSRYEVYFREKILDFYRGKKIQIN